ncbi:MAG: Eco57I restriction-modification methylase domain-containing protein, partial [Planctomyces sp.]
RNATQVHTEALGLLARLHDLPVQDAAERARMYRSQLLAAPAWRQLKSAMDLWCACWFWPAESLDVAPLPSTLAQPSPETQAEAARLAEKLRFFHWELEFPDVFRAAGSGFDAILGNPPWDIAKPNSKEFFSNLDPLYRTYGKQEALRAQTGYFADAKTERRWLDYNADFRAQSNFMKYAASPFGDPATSEASSDRFSVARGRQNDTLHAHWREIRRRSTGFADPAHPFRHQGSADINLYKTFLEQAHAL